MLSLPYALTTKEISHVLSVDESTVRRRAAREDWPRTKRAKKLGGDQWHPHGMPEKTQGAIARALAVTCAAETVGKQPAPPVNAKPSQCYSLNGLPEHGRKKAEAKAYIVTVVERTHNNGAYLIYEVM